MEAVTQRKLQIKLCTNSTQLEEKEKALSAAELEMNALTRLKTHMKYEMINNTRL